ncbi:MAG: ABC transporter substrate-binding protein [Flavisolibacter sp.]|jgi:hypothetical protein|nr:ABC transporter substrate-binding protein [Flavisolibacter sp.]
MKKVLVFSITILFCSILHAQNAERFKVAIFTPMYLDSVFDASGNYRYEKNAFPRFVIPGLEFYQGVQAAIDSLQKRGAPLDFYIFDSRGKESLQQQINRKEIADADLIIAQTNAVETRILAEAALSKKIPFISTNFPNDAGVVANPYFVVLNSTLQTHVEKIYEFIQRNHHQDKIIVFRKTGAQEDQLKNQLSEYAKLNKGKNVEISYVNLSPRFTTQDLKNHLDSNRRNLVIAGSLDEQFGMQLLNQLSSINNTYPLRVIGMPNWERMNLSRLNNLEIIYTTPFYYNRLSILEVKLNDEYQNNINSKPGEMFFRGYETTLRFSFLLLDAKHDVATSLGKKGNTVFTSFDIQPVMRNESSMTLDYFENRNVYFIKNFGGSKILVQ